MAVSQQPARQTPALWVYEIGILGPDTILGRALFLDTHSWVRWWTRSDLGLIAPRAARSTEIRDVLRQGRGVALASTSIRHALGQLEARHAAEQVAHSKTWRYLGGRHSRRQRRLSIGRLRVQRLFSPPRPFRWDGAAP